MSHPLLIAGTLLCRVDELDDPGGRGFWFGDGAQRIGIFVVRFGDAVYAYRNSCPHVGSPLDWEENEFLDDQETAIHCGTHGALFEPHNGYCFSGPCRGESLTPVAIAIDDGQITLA